MKAGRALSGSKVNTLTATEAVTVCSLLQNSLRPIRPVRSCANTVKVVHSHDYHAGYLLGYCGTSEREEGAWGVGGGYGIDRQILRKQRQTDRQRRGY